MQGNNFLIAVTLALALVVGAILSLATGSWWFLPLVAAIHLTATATVIAVTLRLASQQGKPDPLTEAWLASEASSDGRSRRRQEEQVFGIPERR